MDHNLINWKIVDGHVTSKLSRSLFFLVFFYSFFAADHPTFESS